MAGRKMVSLPPELWQAIDDFRFENRFRSEAEAIRFIVERGLKGDKTIDRLEEDIATLRAVAREWAAKAGADQKVIDAINSDDPGAASSDPWLRKMKVTNDVDAAYLRRVQEASKPTDPHRPIQPTPKRPKK
ncbi:hypothetical protein D9623_33590 (plasmid) [Azospirillum brasilense]|nr:hypothetical protein FE88_07835 [Azospirillum brasilense]QCO12839.1 hypothetical protein D3868_27920 [Azospirillum brasilense]QEL94804.1 hypothetical protein D9621_32245 [Azospirillum brasilense]QEM00047.1 hypothetical protein D9623_26840 [Azospirillum brasilense]QEM01351.1 hypothetical protein D9623_33590 [Azospirillum brasilense]